MQSSDGWAPPVEDYQSITPELIAFDELFDEVDASVKTATPVEDDSKLVSPTTSLSPNKGNVGKSRRSRASKKAPTTLLNASPNNFRALVQQFTGCHTAQPSFKGPINLNFEQYRGTRSSADQIQQRHPLQSPHHPDEPPPPPPPGSSTSDQSFFSFNNNSDDFDLDWQELSGYYSGGTPS